MRVCMHVHVRDNIFPAGQPMSLHLRAPCAMCLARVFGRFVSISNECQYPGISSVLWRCCDTIVLVQLFAVLVLRLIGRLMWALRADELGWALPLAYLRWCIILWIMASWWLTTKWNCRSAVITDRKQEANSCLRVRGPVFACPCTTTSLLWRTVLWEANVAGRTIYGQIPIYCSEVSSLSRLMQKWALWYCD